MLRAAAKDSFVTPNEVYKGQELVYELKISEVMSRHVITASTTMTMRQVKDLLRDHRISGLPVMENGMLVGIVTIQDLIMALERCNLDATVADHMTAHVHTIREDEFAVAAVNVFAQLGVGRLPVIDGAGQLAGILTPGDVTRGVLRALQKAYHEEELRRYRVSHLFEDIISDRTSLVLRYQIPARDFKAAGHASSQIKQTLSRLGIDPRIVRRVAIVSYEAEMNVVIHSSQGGDLVAEVTADAIAVLAYDSGPGIPDVERAMQPGFSTAPDWIREMGFGAGMGLSNIKACADAMYLDSLPPHGTRLEAVIDLTTKEGRANDETTRRH